jgi:hypothetical protein
MTSSTSARHSQGTGTGVHIRPDRRDFNHLTAFADPRIGVRAGLIAPRRRTIPRTFDDEWVSNFLTDEWIWAAMICAVPFVAFAMIEALAAGRRRRWEALARRSKSEMRGIRR